MISFASTPQGSWVNLSGIKNPPRCPTCHLELLVYREKRRPLGRNLGNFLTGPELGTKQPQANKERP